MSPQFRALVVENVLIGLMVVDAISLATLCTVAMGGTNILIFPLVIEWFRVFVAGIYLIVMAHRRLHSDFWLPVATFSGETILGAITTTILSLRRNLCDEFHNLPKPCSAAQVAVSLAYITTSAALLSLLAVIAARHLHRVDSAEESEAHSKTYAIELNMYTYPSKEGWTDIPI